ncbi:MAG: TIGR03016 family PEP-CTERM system-associated outer membrane protein, partial [Burkholderiaceae bacterium]
MTATDNGALSAAGQERNDFIAVVRPKVVMSRRGAGLDFDLQASAALLAYANGTQQGGVLPNVRARMKLTAVERLLYLDAAAQVYQSESDPFGARADSTTGANRRTASAYRVSPYIERELWPDVSFLARHDAVLTTNGAGVGSRFVSNHSLIRLERKPMPLGAAAELSRLEEESQGSAASRFTLDTARLRASVALGDQFVLGAVAGADHSRSLLSDHTDSLYGMSAQWTPGPRTQLSAELEQRFFGRAGVLKLRHRMPFMSFALTMSRQPVRSSASLGVLGQGADIRGLLDAILTTRYPDPTVRGELVDNLVTSRGLDTRQQHPVDVVAEYPQLQTSNQVSWTLLGARNTASVTLYTQTLRLLTHDGDPLSLPAGAAADSRQAGGSVQFNRRLTPQLSAGAVVRWSKITGLAART